MAAARNSFAIVGGPSTGKSRLLGKCARAVTLSAAPSKTLILCTDEEVCCEEGREEGMRREDDD